MNHDLSTIPSSQKVPQDNSGRDYDIERMFCAELRYFDTGINYPHHFIAYAIYLVTEYQRVFFFLLRAETHLT